MKTVIQGVSHFEKDASRYAAYLEPLEGRLHTDPAFAKLQDLLRTLPGLKGLRALDLGSAIWPQRDIT